MCKFNLFDAISTSLDPLSGWMEQKVPPAGVGWDLPLLPAQTLEQDLPAASDAAGIPDDLQDVLLDSTEAGAVPSLPADTADCLLEELFSGSAAENPAFFDDGPLQEVAKPAVCPPMLEETLQPQLSPVPPAGLGSPQPVLLVPPPTAFSLSPQPQQQVTLEPWSPTLCPSPGHQPVSPASECHSPELAPAPDWTDGPAARRDARRPRPYDKRAAGRGAAAARRQPLTEEERRERKKEQNKNAATRYRQKKKVEHDLVSGDQEMLEARNKMLRERVGALSRELNYLKQLMREVLRHKQVSA